MGNLRNVQYKLSNDSGELDIKFVFQQFSAFYDFMRLLLDHEIPFICCGFYTNKKRNEEANLCQLIEILRSLNNASFSLKYKNMSEESLKTLLTKNDDFMPNQTKIVFKQFRFLDKEMSSSASHSELAILAAVGIQHMLILDEAKLVPWKSIIMVSCLAGLQIAAGVACLGFGCVNPGLALISEGVGDTFLAVNIYRKREFRMSGFIAKKTVSVVFSMITLGINVGSAVTAANAAVTAENVARQGAQEILERVAQQVLTNLSKHAVRGGQTALIAVSREVVGMVINAGSSGIEARIKELVRQSVRDKLGTSLSRRGDGEFKNCIQKLIAFDSIRKQQTHRDELQSTLENIDLTRPLTSILKTCATLGATLSDVFSEHIGKFAKCLSLAESVSSASDLYKFLDETLISTLVSKVKKLNNSIEISNVLSEFLEISVEKSKGICFRLDLDRSDWTKFDWESKQRNLKEEDAHLKPKLSEFFRLLKQNETSFILHNLIAEAADRISGKVYELISNQHIEPLRKSINKASRRIHDTLHEDIRVIEDDQEKNDNQALQFVEKLGQQANKVPDSVYAKIEEFSFKN
jgi:hypothetical protein